MVMKEARSGALSIRQ